MAGRHEITITVNGEPYALTVESRLLLVELLRDVLGFTGTKRGCETGVCGACTVLLDGRNIKSCLMLAVQAKGQAVTTIEGLEGPDGALHPLQEAFIQHAAVQCGYCTPGMILSAKALLDRQQDPGPEQVREALSGNLCRCTGYRKIIEAVLDAARQGRR